MDADQIYGGLGARLEFRLPYHVEFCLVTVRAVAIQRKAGVFVGDVFEGVTGEQNYGTVARIDPRIGYLYIALVGADVGLDHVVTEGASEHDVARFVK